MKIKRLFTILAFIFVTASLTGCSSATNINTYPLIANKDTITEENKTDKEEVKDEIKNEDNTSNEAEKDTQEDIKKEENIEKVEENKTETVKPVEKEEVKKEENKKEEIKEEVKEDKKKEDKPSITFEEVNETVYATTIVNVRKGPSTDFDKVGSLKLGKSVQRIGIGSNGWSKVIFDGEERYINGVYLSTTKPVTTSYPLKYTDSTASITIYKEWFENAWVYAAHVEFSDYSRLATSCANGKYGGGKETTSHAANRLNAILTINGCYSSPGLDYIVVRDGKIWNGGSRNTWLPAIYSQHNGKFLNAWETGGTAGIAGKNVKELVSAGLFTDSFCFGPPILTNGKVVNNSDTSRAQRTFIGTNGNAGDLWLVVSDGRYNDGDSAGLTYKQMGRFLQEKGCTFGIPLDGGGSTTMVFNGKVLNAAKGNERAVVDFVYFK